MSDLTADERAAACSEFSRALTASFGAVEISCRLGSHSGTREGQATCQPWYDACLQTQASPPATINGCTDKMSGMWSCPITVGQYQDCFNDTNSTLLGLIETASPCATIDANTCGPISPSPACAAAPCDYLWYD